MRRITIRNLAAHKARLVMTLAAVVLGTAFVAGTLFFTASTERAELAVPRRTDVAVQVAAGGGRLPRSAVDRLARLPGVAHAHPLLAGAGSVLGRDGKADTGAGGVTNWARSARFALAAGRAPAGAGEVALSASAARASGARVGGTADLLVGGARHRVTVVGVYEYRTLGEEPTPALAFEEASAGRLLGTPDQVSAVDLVATPGTAPADLAGRVQAAIPGAVAVDGQAANAEARDRRAEEAGTLRNALLGFAAIALLVGTFVIANTFSMLVGQRTRELALLRAVGLTPGQVRRMVLGEAAVVGLLGGVAGVAAGYGFGALALRFLADEAGPATVVVGWPALGAALAVAVGVTVLSALASARRAARTPPVAALRGERTSLPGDLRRRTVAGAVVAAPGLAVYGYAALTDQIDEQVGLVGLGGAALLILAAVLLAPALCRLLLGTLSAPLGRLGTTWRLAAGNARRNPRRTAATASALMISLAVVTGLAIFGHSVKEHTVASVRRDLAAQLVVQPTGRQDAAIPQRSVERLARVPGVRAVAALRYASLPLRVGPLRTRAPATVTDPAALGSALRLTMVSGRVDDLAGGVFVSTDLAARYGLSPGDRLTLGWPGGGERELTLTGVYRASSLVSGLLVPQSAARLEEADAFTAFVALAPGADQAAVEAGLERAVADRPDLLVRSRSEYLDAELRGVDLILGALYALLALALVIGVLGVVNTLALSVVERTREIGLLRALGLTRRQLRAVIRVESALIALVGGVLGVAGGYLLGAMFQRAALRSGLLEAAVPVGQLLAALAGLALAGLVAAAWPARRAARTDVLGAIATE